MKSVDDRITIDEVDSIMIMPPEDEEVLKEQVEYMRCFLNRPKIKDRKITVPLLQWHWTWLHMRYHKTDDSKNGKRIKEWHIAREKMYKQKYKSTII